MYRLVICLAWIFCIVSASPTDRSSSKCSVHLCHHFSFLDCASNEGACFHFQTNNGTSFCAPASSCELLDLCDHHGNCPSNRSVCIINSCCAQPVCLPLILINLCSSNNRTEESNIGILGMNVDTTSVQTSTETEFSTEFLTTATEVRSSTESNYKPEMMRDFIPLSPMDRPRICPKASWNNSGTIVASFSNVTPEDFFVNQYDEIYVPDAKNHRIRKYFPGNGSRWIAEVESDLLRNPTAIFIDRHDNIYVWDSETYRVYLWSSVDKIIRTILSFDGCQDSADFNEICFGKSLFVDSNHSIYISESTSRYSHTNRVMKFEVNRTIGHVIAGISTYGSGMKQLHSPGRIFVDAKGILHVADIDNSRIQRFTPGNRNGTTVLSMQGLTDFLIDQDGHFYVAIQPENVIRRMKDKVIELRHQPTRIHFGRDGSIYVLYKHRGTIEKFQIINNIC